MPWKTTQNQFTYTPPPPLKNPLPQNNPNPMIYEKKTKKLKYCIKIFSKLENDS